jgi:DnaJ-class molecular chaperone
MVESQTVKNPYDILGLKPTATAAEIRSAYRKLAKLHHPDLNPGKPEAEAVFKAISAAHALLSDPEQRGRFDRGEIDASGHERASERDFYRGYGDDAGRTKYRPERGYHTQGGHTEQGFDPDDLESILAQAFASRGGGGRGFRMRGPDAHYTLTVGFLDAVNGTVSRVTLPDGRVLNVTVPAGVEEGQVLRLKGQGMPGLEGDVTDKSLAGDALITILIAPHPLFRREGKDIHLELPVSLQEAVLGAKIDVPTPKGKVTLSIPANSSSGTKLRLKGRGIAGGHQYVTLKLMLPPEPEPELVAFLEEWTPGKPFDPRQGMVTL